MINRLLKYHIQLAQKPYMILPHCPSSISIMQTIRIHKGNVSFHQNKFHSVCCSGSWMKVCSKAAIKNPRDFTSATSVCIAFKQLNEMSHTLTQNRWSLRYTFIKYRCMSSVSCDDEPLSTVGNRKWEQIKNERRLSEVDNVKSSFFAFITRW